MVRKNLPTTTIEREIEFKKESESENILVNIEKNTSEAIKKHVFGVPTFIYQNKLFWGQDRLDFLDRYINNFINSN